MEGIIIGIKGFDERAQDIARLTIPEEAKGNKGKYTKQQLEEMVCFYVGHPSHRLETADKRSRIYRNYKKALEFADILLKREVTHLEERDYGTINALVLGNPVVPFNLDYGMSVPFPSEYRKRPVATQVELSDGKNIIDSVHWIFPDPIRIPLLMKDLMQYSNKINKAQVTTFLYLFFLVHPFDSGNGRTIQVARYFYNRVFTR